MTEEEARIRSYLEAQAAKLSPAAIIEKVRAAMAELRAAAGSVPPARVHDRPEPAEWSGNEVMAHVVDGGDHFGDQIVRALDGLPLSNPAVTEVRNPHRDTPHRSGAPSSSATGRRSSSGCFGPTRRRVWTSGSSTGCSARSTGGRPCSSCACTTSITPASSRRTPQPSPDARCHLAARGGPRL